MPSAHIIPTQIYDSLYLYLLDPISLISLGAAPGLQLCAAQDGQIVVAERQAEVVESDV